MNENDVYSHVYAVFSRSLIKSTTELIEEGGEKIGRERVKR
jgi:hypothetical protein